MTAPTVLVADPDPAFLEQARSNLESEGYVVTVCPDGRAAVAALQELAIDLLVVDIQLPRLDGWKLVKRLRAMEGGASVPVLFMAERSTDTTRREAMRVSVEDVLLKPVHPETLAFRVARALSRRYKVERTQRTLQRASDTRKLMAAAQPTVVRTRPAAPAPPAPTARGEQAALSGDLEHVTLPTVLGMLEVEHKTGRLTVVNGEDGAMGWMELRSGRVIRGRTDAGEDGRGAVIAMLAWPIGAFRFFVEPVEAVDEIRAPITELLIEGARFADESARLEAMAAEPATPPTAPPGPELPRRVPRTGDTPDPADDTGEPAALPASEPLEAFAVRDEAAEGPGDPLAADDLPYGETDDPGPEFK